MYSVPRRVRRAAPTRKPEYGAYARARAAGLHETHDPVVLRVEGDNEAGLGHRVTQQWALAGISFQGLTMCVLGNTFVGYATFDTVNDANRAAAILGDLGAAG